MNGTTPNVGDPVKDRLDAEHVRTLDLVDKEAAARQQYQRALDDVARAKEALERERLVRSTAEEARRRRW